MRCTCGAELPLDARFCHRCGKPQREEDVARDYAAQTLVGAPAPEVVGEAAPAAPVDVSVSNAVAIRIAFFVGLLTTLLRLPLGAGGSADLVYLLALAIGGAYSVFLYTRRTGVELSTLNGARLGWFTGFFSFLIFSLIFGVAALALSDPATLAEVKTQAKSSGVSDETLAQILDVLKSPAKVALTLGLAFVMLTLAPMCGGAITARVLRNRPAANG